MKGLCRDTGRWAEWSQAPQDPSSPHPQGPGLPLSLLPWDSELPGWASAHLRQMCGWQAGVSSVLVAGRGFQ